MSDPFLVRKVFPRDAVKRLARLMGIPVETARNWTYRHLSPTRRRELARALLDEFDRQDTERAAVRRRLEEIAKGEQ